MEPFGKESYNKEKQYGFSSEDIDEDKEHEIPEKLEQQIVQFKNECSFVKDYPDAYEKMRQLIKDAEEFHEVDPIGWQNLINSTREAILAAGDEPEDMIQILREALTEGTTELM